MGSTPPTSYVVPKASAAGKNADYDPAELQGDTRIFKMPVVDNAEVAQQAKDTEAQPRILSAPASVQKLDELAGYNGPVPSEGMLLFMRASLQLYPLLLHPLLSRNANSHKAATSKTQARKSCTRRTCLRMLFPSGQ